MIQHTHLISSKELWKKLRYALYRSEFEKASSLGYNDVSSELIFFNVALVALTKQPRLRTCQGGRTPMKYAEFHLGCEFKTGSDKTFRCTDIGQRVIVAICVDDYPDDTSWYNGPPYAAAEQVIDEQSQEDCTLI